LYPVPVLYKPNKRDKRQVLARHSLQSSTNHAPHREAPLPVTKREALLLRVFQAHEAAVTAAVVTTDDDTRQRVVTSSLDCGVAVWQLEQNGLESGRLSAAKIDSGRPVLSIAAGAKDGIFCGKTGDNEIRFWEPPKAGFQPRVALGPHGGWIRDIQSYGKWMFSCDCNTLRQWDLSWINPRHMRDVSLFKGDILSIAVGGDMVFAGTTDGFIHSWSIAENGELNKERSLLAHNGRINAIAWCNDILYTAGNDGKLKVLSPIRRYG